MQHLHSLETKNNFWFFNNLSKRILYQKMLLIDLCTPQSSKCTALMLRIIIWFIPFLNLVRLMLKIITAKAYFSCRKKIMKSHTLTELSTPSNTTSLISLQVQAWENAVFLKIYMWRNRYFSGYFKQWTFQDHTIIILTIITRILKTVFYLEPSHISLTI